MFNKASLPVEASENLSGIPLVRKSSMDTEFKEAGLASEGLQQLLPFLPALLTVTWKSRAGQNYD